MRKNRGFVLLRASAGSLQGAAFESPEKCVSFRFPNEKEHVL